MKYHRINAILLAGKFRRLLFLTKNVFEVPSDNHCGDGNNWEVRKKGLNTSYRRENVETEKEGSEMHGRS